jgi:ATP-binding cassette subfamily B protein
LVAGQPLLYFVAITALITRALGAMGAIAAIGSSLISNMRAAHDINELVAEDAGGLAVPQQNIEEPISCISFNNVVCGYTKNARVLSEVNGDFVAGRVYALVGKSGSGKSTLADTILGLLPPQNGVVSINGISLAQINTTSLRKRVVLVEQQTRIFTGTIRDNILLGLAVSDEQLDSAIEASGLADFVASLPEGLDTRIEYQGSNISGGQRQRIGIARAIIRKPEVLILDEATSALDQNTRNLVVEKSRGMMREGILILITHDHHIIEMADEVWHVRNGRIAIETAVLAGELLVGVER